MNTQDIGTALKDRRKLLRVSQRDVAELAGVSVHTLSDIETGRGNPTLDVLARILDVVGLELSVEVSS